MTHLGSGAEREVAGSEAHPRASSRSLPAVGFLHGAEDPTDNEDAAPSIHLGGGSDIRASSTGGAPCHYRGRANVSDGAAKPERVVRRKLV